MKTRQHVLAVLGVPLLLGGMLAGAAGGSPAGAAVTSQPSGHWTFDEGTGTVAADSSGHGNPLTLAGGAGFGSGLVGPSALSVNGNRQYAASAGPVIDTARSFTIAAWVKPATLNGYQTYVSQDGEQVSGFFLQLRGDSHRFALTRVAFDSPAGLGVIATSPIIPQIGVWYHLAGVYDATAKTLALYVNGILQQRLAFIPSWLAGGPLAVGRGKYAGNPVDFVAATIDDVRAYPGALNAVSIRQLAGPGRLSVHLDQTGPAVNPTQFGSFLEEINHSGDGGLYAEQVRNRDLKESATQPVGWSAVAGASIVLDTSQPLNAANPVSLKVSSVQGGRMGVANDGYWGIAVTARTAYQVSFYARSDGALTGPLTVGLEAKSGKVWASATLGTVGPAWTKYTATLTTPGKIPTTIANRFVISTDATAAGSLWVTMASLFPPTFHNRANGLRVDLMQKIADTKPGFFRVPGGNYLEGNTLDTRFEWKKTIGPIEQRPGHFNSAWGYWSQDGLGLLEYLQMAEDLGAEPLLAVNAGYALNGTVVPPAALGGYVQDALDEIEYAIGDPSTPWGARRAADGHPAPYNVRYVEIGNEDQFDRSGSYPQRYAAFYDAIKAAHPDLKLVATIRVTNRPMDVVDDHYYNSDPGFFAGAASTYDNTGRSGPKVMVGEFASTQGSTTGTLAAALGEAAFMTGLVRNADVVIGASYAPLLVNENAPNWPTNLIGYDAERSYGSPSYYVQKLFGANLGDNVTPTELVAGNGSLYTVATRGAAGTAYLTVVNRGASASVDVDLDGANASGGTVTVLSGDPAAQNSLAKPTAVSPASHRLGRLGGAFRYTFAANSLTVLALNTGG